MPNGPHPPLLLDAFAVIAVLRGEPSAGELRPALTSGIGMIHPLNLAELLDRMVRADGVDADDVEADIRLLGISAAPVTADDLIDAGRLRGRHYRRQVVEVSLADCVAASCGIAQGLTLATTDGPLARMVRSEGGRVFPLSDSRGRRP